MAAVFQYIEYKRQIIENDKKRIKRLRKYLCQLKPQRNDIDNDNGHDDDGDDEDKDEEFEDIRPSESTDKIDPLHSSNGIHEEKSIDNRSVHRGKKHYYLKSDLSNGVLLLGLGSNEDKRKCLSEERRREYNEYLKEKTKLESDRQKRKRIEPTLNEMSGLMIGNYDDILQRKRREENKYRQLNGFTDIEENRKRCEKDDALRKVNDSRDLKRQFYSEPLNLLHFPSEYFPSESQTHEYITPRNRLLNTESSRIKARQYRNELIKQIDEKQRLKAQEKERMGIEDKLLEERVEEQRKKMIMEYEEEHKRIRKKTDEILHKQEISKLIHDRSHELFPVLPRITANRSPSYMQIREARVARSPRFNDISQHKSSKIAKPTENQKSKVQQRYDVPIGISIAGPSGHVINIESGDEKRPQNPSPQSRDHIEQHDDETESESESEEDINRLSVNYIPQTKVLGHLTEVRKMMESDHIKMLEKLQQQYF